MCSSDLVNQFSQYYNGTQPTFNDLTAAQNQAQTDYNNFQSFGQLAGSESGMQQINSQSAGPNQYSQGMNNLDTLLQNSNPQSLNSFQGQINQNLQNYNQQLQNQNSGIQSQMSNLQNTVQNTAQQTQQAVAQGLTAQQTAQQQALSQLQGQDTTLQQNLAGGVYSNPNGNTNGLSAAQAQALLGINANQFNQLQQLSVAPTQTYTDQFGNVQTVQGNVQVTPQSAFLGQNNLNQSNYMTSQMANQVNALDLLAGQTAQYSNPNQFTGANLGTVDTSQFANDLTAQQSNLQQNVAASQAAQQQAYQNLINQYSNQNTFNKTFGAGAYFNNGSTPDWATQGAQQEQALVSSKIGSNQSFASQFGTDAAKQAALQQIAQNLMKYSVAPPTGGASDGGGDGGAGE